MTKYEKWWESLSPQMQKYLKSQPIWHDKDLYKSLTIGAVVGFIIGFIVGYETAWKPVMETFRPLMG
jgi:hypothetical protein